MSSYSEAASCGSDADGDAPMLSAAGCYMSH